MSRRRKAKQPHVPSKAREPKHVLMVTGETQASGLCYFFRFPFDILLEGVAYSPTEVAFRGHRVRVYTPFLAEPSLKFRIPQVPLSSLPTLPHTLPPYPAPSGAPELALGWQAKARRADALRLDFYPDGTPELALSFMRLWLRLLRWESKQWAIGRDRRDVDGYIRGGFRINNVGERVEDATAMWASIQAGFKIERLVTPAMLNRVARWVAKEAPTPVGGELLLDSIYHHAARDLRRSILDAATSVEVVVKTRFPAAATAWGKNVNDVAKALKSSDTTKHLHAGARALFGRSFADAEPDAFLALKCLRIARHHVAHGSDPVVLTQAGTRPFDLSDQTKAIQGTIALFNWVEHIASGP